MKTKILKVIKSFIFLILVSSLSLVITSCDKAKYNFKNESSKPSGNSGMITKATLTDREQCLVSVLGSTSTYIFDVKLNKDIKSDWVDLWLDHYEKGVLKEPSQSLGSRLTIGENKNLNNTLLFSIENISVDTPVTKVVLAYNGGSGSHVSIDSPKFNNFISMSNDNIEILEDKVLNLAILKQGKHSNSLATSVFFDEEELKKDIAETEHLYMLRCKFSKITK